MKNKKDTVSSVLFMCVFILTFLSIVIMTGCGEIFMYGGNHKPDDESLAVSKKIAQIAEEEGIDWYEIWPELEHYRVFEKLNSTLK